MHSPFGFFTRQCTKDYKLPGTNIVIEKGTQILFSVPGLHYDPKYYDEPTEFRPERFDEKARANKSFVEMPYVPFGEGPRICVASRLAKLQVKIAVVLMLQKFQFKLGPQHINKTLKLDPQGNVKIPLGGINLLVKSR